MSLGARWSPKGEIVSKLEANGVPKITIGGHFLQLFAFFLGLGFQAAFVGPRESKYSDFGDG